MPCGCAGASAEVQTVLHKLQSCVDVKRAQACVHARMACAGNVSVQRDSIYTGCTVCGCCSQTRANVHAEHACDETARLTHTPADGTSADTKQCFNSVDVGANQGERRAVRKGKAEVGEQWTPPHTCLLPACCHPPQLDLHIVRLTAVQKCAVRCRLVFVEHDPVARKGRERLEHLLTEWGCR